MRLNILWRGEGLGGRGRENGFGGGRGGAFMICLLWGATALGMKIDTRQQLDRREPEPQRARVTEWVTVTLQGGWRVTEYSTTTITPTAASAATAIVTVTSIITTGTTVTNTVTTTAVPTTTATTTESTAPIATATTSTAPITTASASTSTFQAIESTAVNTTSTNINTNTNTAPTSTSPTSLVSPSTISTSTGAGTAVSKPEAVTVASVETPQPKNNNSVVVVTDIVTGTPLTTSTVVEVAVAPTSTKLTDTWGQGGPVRRRQAAQETLTLTATSWNWQDGVTTSVITEYAALTGLVTGVQASMAIPTTVTTTMISTQVSTYTTQQTVTATVTPSTYAATASPSALTVDDTPTIGGASPKTPNVEVIVGACFGALVGFIGIFVLAYLWAKKRRDENLRKESAGFLNESFLRSSPGAGLGVRGMIGSLRRGPSARYNNIPNGESVPNMSPLPVPPHSPPPQLPQLRVMPPSGEFNYEYTFGSPVSSIGEAQLHALTSGAISPPAVGENHQDEMFFDLPHRESEQPPWRSPMTERVVAETVVSSVSAQSEGPIPSSSVSVSVSGTQSPTRKPVPVAAGYVVSP